MSRIWRTSLVALGATLFLLPTIGQAQICFRGHPQPRCNGFTVLEFTFGARSSGLAQYSDGTPFYAAWSVGYLHNLNAGAAVGAAFKVSANDDGSRWGPVIRYRRWLGPSLSLDLAPGLFLGGDNGALPSKFPSLTADVAINWGDRVSMLVGLDQLRRPGGNSWEEHVGLRFGTWLAPLALLGLGIIAGASYN
jgi:hypothetical protein